MANRKDLGRHFHGGELLFIAIVKMTIREKRYSFFQGEKLDYLAEYLCVRNTVCDSIRNRVAQMKKCCIL